MCFNNPVIGDEVKWNNKNTGTESKDEVKGVVNNMVALGGHNVSWLLKDDVEIIEYLKYGKQKRNFNKIWKKLNQKEESAD